MGLDLCQVAVTSLSPHQAATVPPLHPFQARCLGSSCSRPGGVTALRTGRALLHATPAYVCSQDSTQLDGNTADIRGFIILNLPASSAGGVMKEQRTTRMVRNIILPLHDR